jgi:hypothetical protein
MFSGIVAEEVGRGCWLIEQDQTRDCIWVHQRFVIRRKFLRVNDRVRFNIAPNPRRPDEVMATDVEIVGISVARQTSAPLTGGVK